MDDGKTTNTDTICQDVDGLTLNDVSGSVEKRPALSYENVQRLNETDVNLERVR